MKVGQIEVPIDAIQAFCEKWKVDEFSLFGSVLREDFRPDSDVDVLIHFVDGGRMDSIEKYIDMQDELSQMFGGRSVDVIERRAVKNPYIRYDILNTRRVIYAA